MKYKRHFSFYINKGYISFSPAERSKLCFTYVCSSCKSRKRFSFIEDTFIYNLDIFYYSGCCDSFSKQELKLFVKERLKEINREDPALVDKLRQIALAFPSLYKDFPP